MSSGYSTPEFVTVTPPPSPAGVRTNQSRKNNRKNGSANSPRNSSENIEGRRAPSQRAEEQKGSMPSEDEEGNATRVSPRREEDPPLTFPNSASSSKESLFPNSSAIASTPPNSSALSSATVVTGVGRPMRSAAATNQSQFVNSGGTSTKGAGLGFGRRGGDAPQYILPPPAAVPTAPSEPLVQQPDLKKPKKVGGYLSYLSIAKISEAQGSLVSKADALGRYSLATVHSTIDTVAGMLSDTTHKLLTIFVKCLTAAAIFFFGCIATFVWIGIVFAVSASYGAFWAATARWWFAPDVAETTLRISFDSTAAVREQWRWAELEHQSLDALEHTSVSLENLFAKKEERHRERILKIISELLPHDKVQAAEIAQLDRFLEREDGLSRERVKSHRQKNSDKDSAEGITGGHTSSLTQTVSSDVKIDRPDSVGGMGNHLDEHIVAIASNDLTENSKTRRDLLRSKWGSIVGASTVWLASETGEGFKTFIPSLRPQQYLLKPGVAYDVKLAVTVAATAAVDASAANAVRHHESVVAALERERARQSTLSAFIFGPSQQMIEMEEEIARGVAHCGDLRLSSPLSLEVSLFDRTDQKQSLSTATVSTALALDMKASVTGEKQTSSSPASIYASTEALIASLIDSLSPSNVATLLWSAFTLPARMTAWTVRGGFRVASYVFYKGVNAVMWVCFGWARVLIWSSKAAYYFVFEAVSVSALSPEERSPYLSSHLSSSAPASPAAQKLLFTTQPTVLPTFIIAENFAATRALLDRLAGMNLTLYRKVQTSVDAAFASPQVTDIAITESSLTFTPRFSGISYYFYHYPIVSFGFIALMNGAVCFAAMGILSLVIAFALVAMFTKQKE